jgi:DNA-binding NarL/FixJ family response regulator
MDAPLVQYATTSDGYSIAFTIQGDGPTLICLPFVFSHAQTVWTGSSATPLLQKLATRFRVVYYDSRGQGLSQRGLPAGTPIESLLLDLRAVIDKLQPEPVVLFADNVFCHVAVRFAVENAHRVAALVLLQPSASNEQSNWFTSIVRQNWDHFLSLQVGLASPDGSEDARVSEQRVAGIKARTTREDFLVLLQWSSSSDISDALPRLGVPSLVLHPGHQNLLTQEACAHIAALIPNSRMVVLSGANFYGDAGEVLTAIESLLTEVAVPAARVQSHRSHNLSARELEVLRLLAAGKSNAQIAADLVISLNTVTRHVSHIYDKTGAANRAEAASYATRNGIA